MSYRWNERTERGWEQDRPLMNGPVEPAGPAAQGNAGTRPPLADRPTPTRRARVRAS